jgi:hypothetical protein
MHQDKTNSLTIRCRIYELRRSICYDIIYIYNYLFQHNNSKDIPFAEFRVSIYPLEDENSI